MPRGKTQRSLDLIDVCHAILEEIRPASVRAVCYQLFIRKLLPSMAKSCTNRVSTQLVYARKQGIIPWDWIVDESREVERPGTWRDPETFADVAIRSYRRDRWAYQPHRVVVMSEKGTVRATLSPVLYEFGVEFYPVHGYTSWTISHDIANFIRSDPRPLTMLYVGDFDPSGLHMSEVDLPENRFRWEEVEVEIRRLAITRADAAVGTLPSFPASDKVADSRYRWFTAHYGDTCWELDAMSPVELRARVQGSIEDYIAWDSWLRCAEVEAAEQRSLRTILSQWPKAGQAPI